MARTTMFHPRNLGGVIARLVRMPNGGAEVFSWDRDEWRPANFAAGDVMAARGMSDRLATELGIPIEEDPSLFPIPGSAEETQIAIYRPEFRNRTAVFVPRNVSGIIARLERMSEGGARIVIWDGPAKRWVPANGAVDGYELLTAPPASDQLMAELGIPEEKPV